MRYAFIFAAAFVAFGCGRQGTQPSQEDAVPGTLDIFGWLGNMEEGKERARQTGKPLMVVFRCTP